MYLSLAAEGIDVDVIKENIKTTCARLVHVLAPSVEHQVTGATGGKDVQGTYYQILGVDLLIDEQLKAWVLEINDNPSLDIYFDPAHMSNTRCYDSDICPVDLHVKSKVVTDTFKLVSKAKSKIESTETFKSMTKIFPLP